MQEEIELVSFPLCPYVQRSAIVLAEKAIAFRRTDIDLSDKPAWFQEISPLGKVPLLRHRGAVLFESSVICEYLDEVTAGSLHPENPLEKARHRGWMEYASSTLNDIGSLYNAANGQLLDQKAAALREKFTRLEGEIKGPLFSGAAFRMVDAAFAPVFRYFDVIDGLYDHGILDGLDRTQAWRKALSERPSVIGAVRQDYPQLLLAFLQRKPTQLGLIARDLAA
ncbi:glutathione S-transferase family protein [Aestuariispira insulae]|uniref:glutathione transferase n=1 Tax=Aestuariispira insulae TaxID=1461337 RepID=A0A3D9HY01_9PROT|nr:glutathione S-transferase family protein [Aestuariispira insulae]RED54382.1 glutathione S-transferase [Aestuariispira insulae]